MDDAVTTGAAPGSPARLFWHAFGPVELRAWDLLTGLVIGLPLALALAPQILPGRLSGLSWRLSCLAYGAVCLFRGIEWRQAGALSLLWLPFLLGVVIDTSVLHRPTGVADLGRQLFIDGFAAMVFGAARDPVVRRVGCCALLVAAGAILTYMLAQTLPMLSSGWSYLTARSLKYQSFQSGFNANEVCFAALVALLAGYREALVPRWISLPMVMLTSLCSVLLGARAPALALLAAACGSFIIVRAPIWGVFGRHRWLGPAATALVIAGTQIVFFSQINAIAYSAFAAQLAGRAALWQIAINAWPQAPVFGFGSGMFQAVIHANLGKSHFSSADEFTSLYALKSGGFHNIWLSVLVERGAVGLVGLFVSWCLLMGFALRHGGELPRPVQFVLFTVLISLLLRGQVEFGGLFDDADGPINQVIMMALGLILPRFAPRFEPLAFYAHDLAAEAAAARQFACP